MHNETIYSENLIKDNYHLQEWLSEEQLENFWSAEGRPPFPKKEEFQSALDNAMADDFDLVLQNVEYRKKRVLEIIDSANAELQAIDRFLNS